MVDFRSLLLSFCVVACAAGTSTAQQVGVLNWGFEKGKDSPEGWTLSGGQGRWESRDSGYPSRSISVTGDGEDSNHWLSAPLVLEPSTLYQLRFRARSLGSPYASGTPVTGPLFCNRDLGKIPGQWRQHTSVFFTPKVFEPDSARLRFGQWHLKGRVAFDSIEIYTLQPVYRLRQELVLGEGERIQGNDYHFQAPYESASRNHSRPLAYHRCGFNTDRWTFGPDSEVVYCHHVAGRRHTAASVEITVNYHRGGVLEVSASPDGKTWQRIGALDRPASKKFAVPPKMQPAEKVWIRLAPVNSESPAVIQVNAYAFHSRFSGEPENLSGKTHFMLVFKVEPEISVTVQSIGEGIPGGNNVLVACIDNRTGRRLSIPAKIFPHDVVNTPPSQSHSLNLEPGKQTVRLPYYVWRTGNQGLTFLLGPIQNVLWKKLDEKLKFRACVDWNIPDLYRADYGSRLPGSGNAAGLWWCSSGWKVPHTRLLPKTGSPAIRLAAARNEAEAVQLVVRAGKKSLKGLTARVSALEGPDGAVIPAKNIDLLRVHYLDIARPTDSTGAAAPWPDPLPPFTRPVDVEANQNQPIWIRVTVPRDAPAGLYRGAIEVNARGYEASTSLEVEVFDFTLPDRMTCSTAFGFRPELVWRYHNLKDPAQRRAVLAKYLENYSRHHISPYDPAPLDRLKVTWKKDAPGGPKPVFDWSAWDAALDRAFGGYHFTSFRLSIPGLGGGTFHARREPKLLGYAEDTPEYRAAFRNYCGAMQAHLREKGWLDEAFVYWFDEPAPRDYAFVMNGFRKLKEAAPDIRRMLTEQVEEGLTGGPNIWCPVSYNFDPKSARERMRKGETFWWYVCCGPKAPYCTLFIDHPATEMRAWLWQTWKRRISGILVWATNYWTSSAAYPDRNKPQNPYEDPMSWTSGYSTPAGVKRPWGNGDGRFVYPPEAAADGTPPGPILDGPVDSIRWEMLRDGIEDYEYLAMLHRLLEKHKDRLKLEEKNHYAEVLAVPRSITRSMTEFTRDPTPIEIRRRAVARAIVELKRKFP